MADFRNQIHVQGSIFTLPQVFTFVSVECDPSFPKHTIEEFERKAVDGVGFRRMGRKASPFRVDTLKDCRNSVEAELYRRDWSNACGRLVTLYDAFGTFIQPLVVVNVVPGKKQALKYGAVVGGTCNGDATLIFNCQWWLRYPYGYINP